MITNTAIFNTSSLILTPVERVVLGLGTKYIPYPKNHFINNIDKLTDSIDTYKRRIRLAAFFGFSPYIPSSIPKIENKPKWNSPPIANFDIPLNNYTNTCRTKQMEYFHRSESYFHDLDQLLLNTLNRENKT